ncbi:hypothetical protein GL272_21255 [Aeromonas veronii]|uniref:antiviral RADAR system adenosine triphosphatase RdrA n=1 Tax=Aeromonas veronii TaxID=654 RepID=UPI001C5A61C5|nr:antiviral RADAR system adenosine triphosphatase RdrA [Aeromonas veronii]MBW3779402.1 hypothetical protein [Aeromonas veronii]
MASTYIPLSNDESAALKDPETILPQATYESLVRFITKARDDIPNRIDNPNDYRAHKAISIDGERGTGKTSVLVNLKGYIELKHSALLRDVHILEPIDPTLLEDGESLFLHVIVAAILHDKEIKESQIRQSGKTQNLNHCLEKLAHSLESIELQQQQYGMDRIRSLYGNKHLSNCVDDFFQAALELLGKKLLVLPIDDVDTSLNRAFENLEIIRRYLTAPCVLPIISGDHRLYDEVCWRDFYGRITKDSSFNKKQAYLTSKDLAVEYQRKILPLPRRLKMPSVSEYWKSSQADKVININKNGISLHNFMAWIEIFILGPVNGLENSSIPLPVPSIRALTQLINQCSDLIPNLPNEITSAPNRLAVRRLWQMPTVPLSVLDSFHASHQKLGKSKSRDYSEAYKSFYDGILLNTSNRKKTECSQEDREWTQKLLDYFRSEPKAGSVYLILLAKSYWLELKSTGLNSRTIFSTPIFQPLTHGKPDYELYEKNYTLQDWEKILNKRLPESWLSSIKDQRTILPYPSADVGINSTLNWTYWEHIRNNNVDKNKQDKAIFLISLLAHRNFYTNAKQSTMLNIGRIFEVIISSLITPLSLSDLQSIGQRAPFFSTSELAPTKAIDIEVENIYNSHVYTNSGLHRDETDTLDEYWQEIHQEISDWREKYNLNKITVSPWLVYKVFNKVYSQFSAEYINIRPNITSIATALDVVGKVFYYTWSAFSSFEKGLLFGLPDIIATTNINTATNFENNEHFRVNISPFAPQKGQLETPDSSSYVHRKTYGEETRSVSYALVEHPLRKWFEDVCSVEWKDQSTSLLPPSVKQQAKRITKNIVKQQIMTILSLPENSRLTVNTILDNATEASYRELMKIYDENAPKQLNKSEIHSLTTLSTALSVLSEFY